MPECFDGSAAPQQGMLGALIVWWPASFWLQWTMAEGTVHTGSPAKFPTKPTEEWKKNRKMYAIKQIKICAEYRDMLPRPRLVCQEPGLRPIGRSPGVPDKSSRGLGRMSWYSAQILICITQRASNTENVSIWWCYHGSPHTSHVALYCGPHCTHLCHHSSDLWGSDCLAQNIDPLIKAACVKTSKARSLHTVYGELWPDMEGRHQTKTVFWGKILILSHSKKLIKPTVLQPFIILYRQCRITIMRHW